MYGENPEGKSIVLIVELLHSARWGAKCQEIEALIDLQQS